MHKVVLFTSQDVACDVCAYLHRREDIDLTVVTQRTLRDEIYGYRPVLDYCRELGIHVLTPKSLDEGFLSSVEAMSPDLVLCVYYPRVFPVRLLRSARLGCVNVHPGLLPEYRGTFPTAWSILNGEREFGVTVHLMDAQIDTGDILIQTRFPIDEEETGHALYRRAMKLCGTVLVENFDSILKGEIVPRPQSPGGSYYNKIDPQYRINWHMPRELIRRQVRVHAEPYFPAYSFLINKCVLICKVEPIELSGYNAQSSGVIRRVFSDGTFAVSCVDGCLLVKEYKVFPSVTPDELRLHVREGNRFQ